MSDILAMPPMSVFHKRDDCRCVNSRLTVGSYNLIGFEQPAADAY